MSPMAAVAVAVGRQSLIAFTIVAFCYCYLLPSLITASLCPTPNNAGRCITDLVNR